MAKIVEKRSVERIPDEERTTGFWPLFFLWAGFTIAIGRLWQGGVIADSGFWTGVIAYVISQGFMVYIAIGAIMGAACLSLRITFIPLERICTVVLVSFKVCGFI